VGAYFRHFANFNKTYGTLGPAVALMVWLYWTGFAMLVGAELKAELAKIGCEGQLKRRNSHPQLQKLTSQVESGCSFCQKSGQPSSLSLIGRKSPPILSTVQKLIRTI
jgi:hypothetical protein